AGLAPRVPPVGRVPTAIEPYPQEPEAGSAARNDVTNSLEQASARFRRAGCRIERLTGNAPPSVLGGPHIGIAQVRSKQVENHFNASRRLLILATGAPCSRHLLALGHGGRNGPFQVIEDDPSARSKEHVDEQEAKAGSIPRMIAVEIAQVELRPRCRPDHLS